MLIPLGFLASSGGGVDTDYELIETHVLGSAQSSVTFSSLGTYSSTYKHLQIRMAVRSAETGSTNLRDLRIQVNGDTGTNYSSHRLRGDGAGVFSDGSTSQNAIFGGAMFPRADNPANEFGAAIVDVLDVYSTSKNTTFRILGGAKPSGEDQIVLSSGAWLNTASVTSLLIYANSGNLAANSRFSIYGIKG